MNAIASRPRATSRRSWFGPLAGIATAGLLLAGCQSSSAPAAHFAANPALSPIQVPPGGSSCDADRAALARFVGVWNFDGWANSGGARTTASGKAAATIENQHFVLIDLQTTSGTVGARAGTKSGSMLLASEPGIGLTLTAWGDASPSMSRAIGRAEGNASAFMFEEARTPAGMHRLSITMTFETNDRWVASIHDLSVGGQPRVAQYTFTREPG